MDRRYFWMRRQKLGDIHRAFIMLLHSQRQCLNSAKNQPGSLRRDISAKENSRLVARDIDQVFSSDQDAGRQITMATKVFCRAVCNQIDPEIKRRLVIRRGK